MKKMINKLKFFSKERRFLYSIIFMFVLSIFLTIVEIVGIASITTLVGLFSSAENFIFDLKFLKIINLNFYDTLSIIFLIFLIKGILQIFYNFLQAKINQLMTIKYSQYLFTNFVNSSYELNLLKNPSILIRKISSDVQLSISYIFVILLILKEFLILFAIFIIFFFTKTNFIVFVLLFFSLLSILFYKSIRNKIRQLSSKFIKSQSSAIKIVNQAFGSLKENIILDINQTLVRKFVNEIINVNKFEFFRSFIKSLPRIIFELTAITSVVIIAFILFNTLDDKEYALQVLTLIAVCSVRLIPSFNVITNAFASIRSYQEIFDKFYKDLIYFDKNKLNYKKTNSKNIKFNSSIELKNVSFKYPKTKKFIIKNANLKIIKGKIIGIFGRSGEGKTTLIDLIIGLLKKESGKILVDKKKLDENVSFKKNSIGYVPQSPFLTDDTIENNIIFGRKIKNKQRLIKDALKFSQLDKFIKSLPNGINTIVGNNGVRLSGGQKQRIVIARALLLRPSLIVFDEATSSLDSKTENELMKEILKLNKITTVLIISHKLEIIKKCNLKYLVKNKKIKKYN